jgi:photosystem II stability/assembly factor-like uncharacterized protein
MLRSVAVTVTALLTPSLALAQLWVPLPSGTVDLLDDVWFTDAQNGWVVGDAGLSRVTQDGGQSWAAFFLTNVDLSDVEFTGSQVGLIVGDNGLIFRTVDAGVSWAGVASGTGNNLRTTCFSGTGRAYAAGRDGTIVRSADDGATWSLVETGADRYRDSAAVGDRAWIVGDGGVIRATTNGGASWFNQNSGTGNDLHGVFFLDAQEGWIGGQNNTLLYTADGGTSWVSRNAGLVIGPDAVHFVDSGEGWVVGNAGAIYHTVNGGLLWTPEASGTTNPLNDVHFIGPGLGWAVGDLGTIVVRDQATGVVAAGSPSVEELRSHPNPFVDRTEIALALPTPGHAALRVYDVTGRLVRTLADAPLARGRTTLEWNGRDAGGATVSPGVYLLRLETESARVTRKVVRVE